MHKNSFLLFDRYAKQYFADGSRILEIGPSGFPSAYQRAISNSDLRWETLDIAEKPQLTYSGVPTYSFPIPDETYDIVLSGQVFEHVPKVWQWMSELARITKIGGYVIVISPVSWPYHEAPHDCWRAYPEGMRALCEHAGLAIEVCEWASLEGTKFHRTVPGVGLDCQNPVRRVVSTLLGVFGFPVEVAFDMVTVGKKTAPQARG